MGGSGGGSSSGTGSTGGGFSGGGSSGGGSGSSTNCYQLIFDTTVASPNAAVLASLSVNDVCDLELLSSPTRIAVVTRTGGDTLGAIANRWEELVGCIGQGVAFEAELLTVTTPVQVNVRPI